MPKAMETISGCNQFIPLQTALFSLAYHVHEVFCVVNSLQLLLLLLLMKSMESLHFFIASFVHICLIRYADGSLCPYLCLSRFHAILYQHGPTPRMLQSTYYSHIPVASTVPLKTYTILPSVHKRTLHLHYLSY